MHVCMYRQRQWFGLSRSLWRAGFRRQHRVSAPTRSHSFRLSHTNKGRQCGVCVRMCVKWGYVHVCMLMGVCLHRSLPPQYLRRSVPVFSTSNWMKTASTVWNSSVTHIDLIGKHNFMRLRLCNYTSARALVWQPPSAWNGGGEKEQCRRDWHDFLALISALISLVFTNNSSTARWK